MGVACQKFHVEKTFAGGCKIAKFVKVFSLESFPLYGIFHGFLDSIYVDYTVHSLI